MKKKLKVKIRKIFVLISHTNNKYAIKCPKA